MHSHFFFVASSFKTGRNLLIFLISSIKFVCDTVKKFLPAKFLTLICTLMVCCGAGEVHTTKGNLRWRGAACLASLPAYLSVPSPNVAPDED